MKSKILRFAIVGGGATIVHMIVATISAHAITSLSILGANTLGFAVALLVSFFGHSLYTFKAKGNLWRFITTSLIGLASNNIVAYISFALSGHKILSIMIGTITAPGIVYILSEFWVFTHKKNEL